MSEVAKTAPKGAVLPLVIKDKALLYASYMSFVKGGGIFVPTIKPYNIGDNVLILLTLMEEPERLPIQGQVIWISPAGEAYSRAQGVGIQFIKDELNASYKIVTYLSSSLLLKDQHIPYDN